MHICALLYEEHLFSPVVVAAVFRDIREYARDALLPSVPLMPLIENRATFSVE